ncbi:hypothetical protein Tco_0721762 [Tanacetum coccineum]
MADSQLPDEGAQRGELEGVEAGSQERPSKPAPLAQTTLSPASIKENINVLRTMIKEHGQQAKTKATPKKFAYNESEEGDSVKAALEDVEDEYEGMRSYSVAHEIIRRHVQRFHDHTVEDPSSTSSVLLRVIQRIKVYRIISACRRVVMRQRRNNIEHVLERLRLSSLDCSMIVLLMTEVYCPRNEIQKLETGLWNLTVKGNDLTTYTKKFQELVLLCTRMVPNEEDKVERFIGEIEGICKNVLKTKNVLTINRVIIVATSAFKRQNVGGQNVTRAYTAGNNEKKGPGHYRKDFPKLRNQNRRNKTGNKTVNNEATTKAYAIRGGGANLDSNVFTLCSFSITILCFYVIHSGATGVSVSSTISALLDVLHPSTLDTSLF